MAEDLDPTADGDALRAARFEAVPERTYKLGGRLWKLHPEVPFEVGEALARNNRRRAFQLLLADMDEINAFMALRPSAEDIQAILDMYRVDEGESSAS